MEDTRWRCTYCGAVNDAENKACSRCSVRGVIKAPVKSKAHVLFGFVVIALFIIVIGATFL
jgi:DNA-directed RNA polymerase subunit RPC12/RpoP